MHVFCSSIKCVFHFERVLCILLTYIYVALSLIVRLMYLFIIRLDDYQLKGTCVHITGTWVYI